MPYIVTGGTGASAGATGKGSYHNALSSGAMARPLGGIPGAATRRVELRRPTPAAVPTRLYGTRTLKCASPSAAIWAGKASSQDR